MSTAALQPPMRAGLLRSLALIAGDRDALLEEIAAGTSLTAHWVAAALVMVTGAALYGAVLGMWRDATLALYVSIKLPLLLVATSSLTLAFSWILARGFNTDLSLAQVGVVTFLSLAVAAVLLAALAPVVWFFTLNAPPQSPDARGTHNALYLVHTAVVGGCGISGTRWLWKLLSRMRLNPRAARTLYALWTLTYALVGGEVAWALRPFVGSVYYPVDFIRADALDGNVYEFVLTDIAPYLLSKHR